MKNLIGIALASALVLVAAPAFASDPCKDGTAPAGWLRDGGYCSVVADNKGHENIGEAVPGPNFWSKDIAWKDFPAWKDAN